MHKIYIDKSLSLHRYKVSDIKSKINNVLVFLLFYNFAVKELHYHKVCLSLIIGATAYQPVITGKCFFKNATMFPILYYEYNYNTACHKIFIMIPV